MKKTKLKLDTLDMTIRSLWPNHDMVNKVSGSAVNVTKGNPVQKNSEPLFALAYEQ